ncbi:OmpA family protein [Pseudanabaenaceae cyanobacterium LEGE 13415]|nr:OmpA family protein [Pseudanabaenaceae cyanobacterium LEGE 13415]
MKLLIRSSMVVLALSLGLISCRSQPSTSTIETTPAQGSSLTVTPATAPNPTSGSNPSTSGTPGSTLTVQPAQGSYLTEKRATASDPQIQKTLTDLDARQTPKGEIIVALSGDVLFDFDKATIRADAKETLAKIDRLLEYYSKAPVEIDGHTDAIGNDQYNQNLSNQRAAAVRDYLVSNFKIDNNRLKTQGFGKTQPVAANTKPDGSDNPQGRQLNRRVEVKIQRST